MATECLSGPTVIDMKAATSKERSKAMGSLSGETVVFTMASGATVKNMVWGY
jgi:hypothetical protein